MFIYVLDKVNTEYLYYYNKKIVLSKELPDDITYTWKYNTYLNDSSIEYVNIYVNNRKIEELTKQYNIPEFPLLQKQLNTHVSLLKNRDSSALRTKSLNHYISESLLLRYCSIMEQVSDIVFNNVKKPNHYDIMSKIIKVTENVKFQKLNIDSEEYRPYIHYNPFKVVTGRMGLDSGYFPITNLKKENRHIIQPNFDFLYELDYNSAEIRVILTLMGFEYTDIDIHDYHNIHKFSGLKNREFLKRDFYSWLYNPSKTCKFYDSLYTKKSIDTLRKNHYVDGYVQTIFGRKIECEERKWLNYLAQSTCSDLFFDRVYAIWSYLKKNNLNSRIYFTLHDSLVLDVCEYERDIVLDSVTDIFRQTHLGEFLVNQKIGVDYGHMNSFEAPNRHSQAVSLDANGLGRV